MAITRTILILAILVSASIAAAQPVPGHTPADAPTLAERYPGDAGIEADPAVLFHEDFEGSIDAIRARWTNAAAAVRFEASGDVHRDSPGERSLRLDGRGSGSQLYQRLPEGIDRLYMRYYIRYGGTVYHHTGGFIGGYLPATNWPQGDAGLKGVRPNGDRLIQIALEAHGGAEQPRLDFYNNWIDMRGIDYQGHYYGRSLLRDRGVAVKPGAWQCVEIMAMVNTRPDSHDGELVLWIDGREVARFEPGTPRGGWDRLGAWRDDPNGEAFEGFQWRDTLELSLNWVKVQNYDSDEAVWFDDLVVATERIGPVVRGRFTAEDAEGAEEGRE